MDSSDHNKPTQSIVAKEGSTVKNVIQAIIHLPAWAWITGVVILSISLLLISAVFNIGPLQGLLPTPTAFAPATADQSLIIVADFDNRSNGKYSGIDPAQYVYEQLLAQAQKDSLNIRVERLRQVVDDNSAKPAGETYDATMVVWGWYDSLTITPRITRTKILKGGYSNQEGELRLDLTDPETVDFNIVTDLPNQTGYLVMFTLGIDKYTNDQFDEALSYFESSIQSVQVDTKAAINPSESYFYRGNIYYKKGNYASALADYEKAIELTSNYPDAYINSGNIYYYDDDYDRAIANYSKAIEINPDYATAYYNRGVVFNAKGNYDRALIEYDKALQLKTDYFEAYGNRGNIYNKQGEYDRAIADYNKAIELIPRDSGSYNNRGSAYANKGEYDLAIADYNQAIKLDPYNEVAYYNRADTFKDMGEDDLAIVDFDKAIKLNPSYLDAYNQRGIFYYFKRRYDLAIADFNTAIQLNPDYPLAYMNRGLAYDALGYTIGAIKDFEKVLEISTDAEMRKRAEEKLKKLNGQ